MTGPGRAGPGRAGPGPAGCLDHGDRNVAAPNDEQATRRDVKGKLPSRRGAVPAHGMGGQRAVDRSPRRRCNGVEESAMSSGPNSGRMEMWFACGEARRGVRMRRCEDVGMWGIRAALKVLSALMRRMVISGCIYV